MFKYIPRSVFGLSLLLSAVSAQAVEPIHYGIYQPYVSPRALGMGNAFIALADDYNTLFYNPAGLARLDSGTINLKLQAGLTSNFTSLAKDIETASGGNKTDQQKSDALIDLVAKQYGTTYWSRLPGLGGIWTRPGWGIAFLPIDLDLSLGFHQQLGPVAAVEAYADSVLQFGIGKNLGDNPNFNWGVAVKTVHRGYAGKLIPAAELASNSNYLSGSDVKEGLTFDVDAGLLYTFQAESGLFSWSKPTLAVVGRNLIDYGFKQNLHVLDKKSEEPPKLIRRFDVGGKTELPKLWVFSPRFMMDIKDIGHPFFTLKKGMHAGFELNWDVASWLRGGYRMGYGQGYLTAGVSAQLIWFRLDLATWSDELGTTSAPIENRRYMVQMSLDF